MVFLRIRLRRKKAALRMPEKMQELRRENTANLDADECIQPDEESVVVEGKRRGSMTTWHKRDWQQFYERARRPWQRHRPPRPVCPAEANRVVPAAGFSLSELDDAGVNIAQAEMLGLP